jgi:hypothetical protein
MRRREFITVLGGAASWPITARAQQPAMTRVGIVTIQPRTRLRELGYAEGQNLRLEFVNPAQQAGGNAGATGRGSTFTIRLPRIGDAAKEAVAPDQAPAAQQVH